MQKNLCIKLRVLNRKDSSWFVNGLVGMPEVDLQLSDCVLWRSPEA